MINVQLNGGLGNQMFQYAFGKALAYKHSTKLLLDTSQLNKKKNAPGMTTRYLELDIFNLDLNEANENQLRRLKPLPYRIANALSLKLGLPGIQTSKYFIENGFSFNSTIERIGKDCFLTGYWQSFKYFQNIEPIIRKEFQFKHILDDKNLERVNQIKKENSISLHIRRSDFVNNKFHDIHGSCSLDYYRKAIEYLADKVRSPFFFIFSDDMEWARTHLNLNFPCEFIAGNSGKQSYIDLQLMSLCQHNIIANSSFSWWGAWLNPNPDKLVVAPKQWFADEKMNTQTKDLIPGTWIRL